MGRSKFRNYKLIEMKGLKFISSARIQSKNGVSYGGVAIVVNLQRFTAEKLPVKVPSNLEAVWAILRSKETNSEFKKIIV